MDPVLLAKLARQGLIFVGGLLVSKGLLSQDQVSSATDALLTVAGAITTIAPIAWALYRHFRPTTAIVSQVNTAAAAAVTQ